VTPAIRTVSTGTGTRTGSTSTTRTTASLTPTLSGLRASPTRTRTASRTFAAVTAAALTVATLSGCISIRWGGAAGGSPSAPPTTSTAIPTPEDTDDTDDSADTVDLEALDEDTQTAIDVVDTFWAAHWSEYFTGEYTSPTVYGYYDGTDPDSAPSCNGEPLEAGNAFYCGETDELAWDVSLMSDGYRAGDAFPYLVVAHEWGHSIQARVDDVTTNAYELQADCLAAAALYGAAMDGTLQFEEGDEKEITNALTALADSTGWTDTTDHGDTFQRIEYFDAGRQGGVAACLPAE
jgi:predicted metalloprotease